MPGLMAGHSCFWAEVFEFNIGRADDPPTKHTAPRLCNTAEMCVYTIPNKKNRTAGIVSIGLGVGRIQAEMHLEDPYDDKT